MYVSAINQGATKITGLFFYIILFVFQLRDQSITWDVNFSSAFFLMAEKTSVEAHQEQLEFGPEDLINGLGGALGLFLGWSILYLGTAHNLIILKPKFSNILYMCTSTVIALPPTENDSVKIGEERQIKKTSFKLLENIES